MPDGQQVCFLKHSMALIILGWYCSCVAHHSWHVRSLGTSHCNNRISISPSPAEKRWHALTPGAASGGQKKEGWLILVTYISVVLITSMLAATWVIGCPASLLMASPSHFLPPCRIMFQGSIRQITLILLRHLPARPASFSSGRTCHRGSYGLFRSGAPPISTHRALLPIVSSGNFCLDSNMAVLSP